MVMFELYVCRLRSGYGIHRIESHLEPNCFCNPKPRETDEFVARSEVSTHFWCTHSHSHAKFFGSPNTSSSTPAPGIRRSKMKAAGERQPPQLPPTCLGLQLRSCRKERYRYAHLLASLLLRYILILRSPKDFVAWRGVQYPLVVNHHF